MSTHQSATKSRILAAALELLRDKGGKGVRMADIAAAADVSRQAVYLHFESRLNLMVETVRYGDEVAQAAAQVRPWQEASGTDKLDAWIEFWGNYIPQIYGVAKALMLARETDDAADAAWNDRMADVRRSCKKTIDSLAECGQLASEWKNRTATDLLWNLLSFPAWEQYTQSCGWSKARYIRNMQVMARRALVEP